MLAAFASLSVLAATASSACDVTELAKCARTHQKPYLAPDFPLRASADQSGDYCEWASKLYGCIKDAGCMEPHLEKECARAFELAGCDGADVCKQGHRALADIEKRKPEPAPANAPASAPAPVEPEPTPAPAADADAAAADAEGEATDAEPDAFDYEKYPPHAPFFGFMGAAGALVFANLGAAYGTAKSGRGISTMGVLYPNLVMKHIIPVVMAGVLGIYGLIIAVIIGNGVTGFKNNEPVYTAFKGFAHLGGGLACGLSGLAAGLAIGIVGDYGVRSAAEQPKLYVGMVLVLIFSEALGLYGLIVGLILTSK